MKALIATSGVLLMAGSTVAAQARPYAVIENNGGFTGSNFTGTVTDLHVGWEEQGFYAEFGPSVFAPDGGDTEVLMTAKAGGSVGITDKLSVYGELGVTVDDTNSYSTKLGAKYSF